MKRRFLRLFCFIILTVGLFASEVESQQQADESHPSARTLYSERSFLWRYFNDDYHSYAFHDYENYSTIEPPYQIPRRNIYDPLGNKLLSGNDVFDWTETRIPGGAFEPTDWSSLSDVIPAVFNNVISIGERVEKDGQED